MNIQATHSYRATLVPPDMAGEDVEAAADAGALPFIQLRSTNSDKAAADALLASGLRVLRIERIEPAQPVAA